MYGVVRRDTMVRSPVQSSNRPEDRKRPRLCRFGQRLPMRQILADTKRGNSGALPNGFWFI